MELTMYGKVTRALSEYFSSGDDTIVLIIALIMAVVFLIIILQTAFSPAAGEVVVTEKDLDFFEVVIQQKGLENFDRDLLLELAEVGKVTPVYRVLIEVGTFERALKKMEKQMTVTMGTSDELPIRLDYLRRLKKRLFQ